MTTFTNSTKNAAATNLLPCSAPPIDYIEVDCRHWLEHTSNLIPAAPEAEVAA